MYVIIDVCEKSARLGAGRGGEERGRWAEKVVVTFGKTKRHQTHLFERFLHGAVE
jgi:hypothetical protein